MIPEANIFGVFVSSALVTAILAWIALALVQALLRRADLYRFVAYPSLFHLALFVILWSLTVMVFPAFAAVSR